MTSLEDGLAGVDHMDEIVTENPTREQWRLLSRYSYRSNIVRYFRSRHDTKPFPEAVPTISGSFAQAREYFESAQSASLFISPLLVYYGLTNLMAGASMLVDGVEPPDISSHGLHLESTRDMLADIEVTPTAQDAGAFSYYVRVLGSDLDPANYGGWSLSEIMASIPGLHATFERCYDDKPPGTLPIDIYEVTPDDLPDDSYSVHRIRRDIFNSHPDGISLLSRVPDYDSSYLKPQLTNKHVILHQCLRPKSLLTYTEMGAPYLPLGFLKHGNHLVLEQLTLFCMGLYALATLSRYHADWWTPFVQADETGERHLVEHFLDHAARYTPNLVLNCLLGTRVQFHAR